MISDHKPKRHRWLHFFHINQEILLWRVGLQYVTVLQFLLAIYGGLPKQISENNLEQLPARNEDQDTSSSCLDTQRNTMLY